MLRRAGRIGLVLSLACTYLLQLNLLPAQAATTYTFTNAGVVGVNGPLQSEVTAAYTATSLAGAVTVNTRGIQEWVVPFSGQYRITAKGASGGKGKSGGVVNTSGFGAQLVGTFTLTAGTTLKIAVGQEGQQQTGNDGGGGGGGGSFIVTSTGTILIIAGGGGGGGGRTTANANGVNASLNTAGTLDSANKGSAGSSGNGGSSTNTTWTGGGGGGYLSNGTGYGNGSSSFGYSFANGLMGGAAYSMYPAVGGFGGGGGVAFAGGGGGGYSGGAGGDGSADPYPGGGGGGSINNGTSASASVLAALGNGSVVIDSLGPSLTTFTPRNTITKSSTLVYDIAFSENVTGLASGDFSLTGTGSSTCSIGSPSGSGSTYTVTLSGCSPGLVVLTMATAAAANASSQSVPSSNTSANSVLVDQTAPTITSVSAPASATYLLSNSLTFNVLFSESVTVTGSPRLTLTVGAITKYATFSAMSDSKTAQFVYSVGAATEEFDADGIATSTTLDLNSGTIGDLASNALSALTFTAPNLSSVLVAQPAAAPVIDSVTATSGQLTIYFTPGAARGSTTTTYQYSSNGAAFTNRASGTTTSPLIITGLSNGTGYTIRIRATTNAGAGDSSTAVTETPTSISVTGDSALVLTYGNSASTGTYSATGGTNSYVWSLGSSLTGVTLSGTTVTASASTPAGTYSQTVRATDGNSQVGSKSLTITVSKASTSISIALPNSTSTAALGGAVTITATVPRAGAVNFMLGGATISGCAAASASSTTATCSWTPGALGSVSLTATFTPTDSSNFETSTTSTLSITVVNGISSVTLSLTGGTTTPAKGQSINIIAAIDQAGKVSFFIDGKRIPTCQNMSASIGNKNCSWKPAIQKQSIITARLVPTNNVYDSSTSSLKVQVVRRSGTR